MGANGVTTPGENEPRRKEGENEEELDPSEATRYRGIAARANYHSADRPDIMYAVKELCRGMARPTNNEDLALNEATIIIMTNMVANNTLLNKSASVRLISMD